MFQGLVHRARVMQKMHAGSLAETLILPPLFLFYFFLPRIIPVLDQGPIAFIPRLVDFV